MLISRSPTVIKLMPLRVLKKVLVIVTLTASEMDKGNVSADRAGSAVQLMVPTLVNLSNWSVDNKVKLNRVKEPLDVAMDAIEALEREVNWPALLTIKLPEMEGGPSKLRTPDASGPMRTLPATPFVQSATAVASA